MNMRSSRSTVRFANAFVLMGYADALPAGDYDVLVEEERLQGLSFEAWRRTATYLLVQGRGRRTGDTEMRATTERDLEKAQRLDRATSDTDTYSDAALSPLEDLT
ncbi:MAG: hypothetical protein EP318_13060 [Rhodobacteraceae bacterium]|nr:MAG: hypothetical protein EP318_13060 [Paracoccaceae bacterium]